MKPSVRQVLADTHIAAIAIAILLLSTIKPVFRALELPLERLTDFVATAIAIRGAPSNFLLSTSSDRIVFGSTAIVIVAAGAEVVIAWFLSRWVYGEGPLRSLRKYRGRLPWRRNA
jgi:hypothetical protein